MGAHTILTLYMEAEILETTFRPGSVSVSKIKQQRCKVVPKRVPDILK